LKRGFRLTPKGYAYMRQKGDIWHFIYPAFSQGNQRMQWVVSAWVPELAYQPYDLANLPDELLLFSGGRLGRNGPGSGSYEMWPAADAQECTAAFPAVLRLLDEVGIPWLDRIATREDLARNINPNSAVDAFGNKTVDKIFGRNLLYRAPIQPGSF
jgi:hypothetical protein